MTTTPITVTLDLSWPEQARTDHLDAHDELKATGWTPDTVETLRVTWHRDCPRCPRPGLRRDALKRWRLRRGLARLLRRGGL